MPTPLAAPDAQAQYEADALGNWHEDSRWGVLLALDKLIERALVQRVHRAAKRAQGIRQREDQPLPDWAREAYAGFKPIFEAMQLLGAPLPIAFAKMMGSTEGRAIVEELLELNSVEILLAADREGIAPIVASAQAELQTYKPRENVVARGLFDGTTFWFYAQGRPSPTAKILALLGAATGIEPLPEGLTAGRALWDGRVHAWRRDLEARAPRWREAIDQAAAARG